MDIFLVIVYVVFWASAFFLYRRKSPYFGAGSLIMTTNLIYAIFSFFYVGNTDESFTVENFSLLPFIYLFVSILICSGPVLKYERVNVAKLHHPRLFLIDSFSIAYIIATILVAPIVFGNLLSGLVLLLMDSSGGAELYRENAIQGSSSNGQVGNLLVLFYGFFTDISIFTFFYYFTIKKNRFWLKLGLGLTLIISTLRWVSLGTRTGVMSNVLTMLVAYLLFYNFLHEKTRKQIKRIILIGCAIVSIPFLALTVSKNEGSVTDAFDGVIEYVGQANLNFNKYGLDAGGIRYGDRTMGYFKYWLGLNPRFVDGVEIRDKYSHMDIDDGHFYTFVGDFTLDYGPFVAFLIFVVFSIIMMRSIKYKNEEILFHHLILVFFVACVVIQGGMYLFTYSLQGNGTLIAFFLFYFLFKIDYDWFRNGSLSIRHKIN